ncbi:Calmodulin-like protein 11 [Tritrichomonas foetus]|uniref:Calmodulin-like protein 11 n=1 Tax=Tritrichomonas foetus TaxID=1144522 RepID=A0A1J4JRN0_9EUKA|nr:Calmodulin-like protein 11 [Tritrichomonas foetus]|eukprot:OHS99908.1 Calmodulin-like protein 11 [Tritrichomonas foetus]
MEGAIPTKEKLQEALKGGMQKADADGDGKLSSEEFVLFTKQFMESPDETYLKSWFRGIDVEGAGKLEFKQVEDCFKMMLDNWDSINEGKPPLEMLKIWYRSMDVNRNGQVNLDEMQNFLISIDKSMTTQTAAVKLRKMDREGNNDGQINFHEFCHSFGVDVKKGADAFDGKGNSSCCILI